MFNTPHERSNRKLKIVCTRILPSTNIYLAPPMVRSVGRPRAQIISPQSLSTLISARRRRGLRGSRRTSPQRSLLNPTPQGRMRASGRPCRAL
eukprot:12734984-Heterocapsa_arctica.AAC.1